MICGRSPASFATPAPDVPGAICGRPLDTEHFDESGLAPLPPPGGEVRLARFALRPQYCGRLENFCQFTDAHARSPDRIETPELLWLILVNDRPLYPFLNLERIVNPWGFGGFPFSLRLDECAVVEFVVRNIGYPTEPDDLRARDLPRINRVGGRIIGRYWFNPLYGDASAPR